VVHIAVAGYIVDHYCLMFDREVVHIVVEVYIVNKQYEALLCQTLNSNGQQYEPFLCQTSNSNWEQYNSHSNMNRTV
jgi:hypothetical protein